MERLISCDLTVNLATLPPRSDGLSLNELKMLAATHRIHSMRMVDLAKFIGYSTAGCTLTADNLEEKQYIFRAIDPNDRRSIRIRLTDKGRNFIQSTLCNP